MVANIPGKYDFVSTDKYEDFLKVCGVGAVQRTIASKIKNQLEFIDNGGGSWTQKTFSTFKNFQIDFKLGEPFEENTADGRKCEAVVTLEGNKFIHKQTLNGETAVVTREFKPNGELTCTFQAKDVIAVRTYKKI